MILVSDKKKNVFQSVVDEYKKLISFGAMQTGEKLPSVRALALEKGINPNTVEKAYTVLEQEGYITIVPKQGAYVSYNPSVDKKKRVIYEHLNVLRKANIPYDEIICALNEIYKGENSDD